MFIEAAFFRICEGILRSPLGRHDWTEEQIRGLFAQSIVDELSSRFIKYPSLQVHIEKRYPLSRDVHKSLSVDIHADFSNKDLTTPLYNYGFRPKNWIEIKYFSGWSSSKSSLPTTENAASIMKDFLRLIILTGGNKSLDNRYLIALFDNEPEIYLAKKIKKGGKREWLEILLDKRLAEKKPYIDFSAEPNSFSKKIRSSNKIRNVSLTLYSQTFLPKVDERLFSKEKLNANQLLVYCYLFRIDDFKVTFEKGTIPAPRDEETYKLCCNLAKDLWA